ncbi:MAG: hypothetical protein Q8K86_05915 [Candidatus Nanopelagicaceae bacterium]|nr:hypothetical protein [Candidatus Nanopelagicaceae bacterium]
MKRQATSVDRCMLVHVVGLNGEPEDEIYLVSEVLSGCVVVVSEHGQERRMHPSRLVSILPQRDMIVHWRKPRKHGRLCSHVWLHPKLMHFLITTVAVGAEKKDVLAAWLTAPTTPLRRKALKESGMHEYPIKNEKHLQNLIARWAKKEFMRCDEET